MTDRRSSGDSSSNLHILAQNPTFSTYPDHDTLHAACPTMGLVGECGFTRDIVFATDVFPLRITFDVMYSDPFEVFPEYENLFLAERLPHILGWTGVVLLLFGATAYEKADALRKRSCLDWDEQMALEHLDVYLETYKVKRSPCKH